MSAFGYDITDYIPCEVCNNTAVDIHHIDCRGMGGSSTKDDINNLMALCRKCHVLYGDIKKYTEFLKSVHNKHLKKHIK